MDVRKVTELLRATIDPAQQKQAEEQLNQIHKIIGFAPTLLQVVMTAEQMPVRQAGVIYLKNLITTNWADRESENGPVEFSIHEQDRAMIRDAIVDALVHAPELIRAQLAVCINNIVKHDFPGRWTQIVDKITIYLQNSDASCWPGVLLALYQLVKNFEYKKAEERGPLNEAMNLLFPMIYQLMLRLLPDSSEQSVLLQKQILKIFFALTQYTLPLDLISKEVFSQWMDVVRQVADRPVPPETNNPDLDDDDRAELPWWKCKKWALHILHRVFERYGSPGNVTKEYQEFAEWYLRTFSGGILEVLLKILDQYRRKIYVSPRVIQQSINYINQGVSHAFSWKFLKPHMFEIIRDVLFPILSYSAADEELWINNPYEYIRLKFDIFEDFVSPVTAAQTLLHSACKKRKDMLQETMQFCVEVLTSPNADPRQKDGALHMVGSLADVLLKKKVYKEQMDKMLLQYVFPEFNSPHGHMRARACWVLHYFSEIKFKQEQILVEAVRLTTSALLTDQDLPVKVEAAIALQMLLSAQEKAQKYVEPLIKPITLELLTIVRETENDDLTTVIQKMVHTYSDQLMPIAVEMCQHLATTFSQVLETDEGSDEKAITAMGLLSTIETLLSVMEKQPQIMAQLQPTVLQVVAHIFGESVMEFYEEALSLVYDLTKTTISEDMWKVLELMYQLFQKDGFEYFTDMMPALHNYIIVDTPAFLSNENHILAMFNMCKAVLTGDAGEDPECHAAKLLEIIILQCKGHIDQCIPSLVQLVLERLMREVKTSELRTMCLQVVIAALYYNPALCLETMDRLQGSFGQSTEPIASHFIKQWIHDTDCFLGLHDRKLCVLGLCTLISMGPARPPAVNECAQQIIPSLILLFDGLKRAYAAKVSDTDDEENEEDDSDIDTEVLSSDEDEIDDASQEYLEKLQEKVTRSSTQHGFNVSASIQDGHGDHRSDVDGDDSEYDANEETPLECYATLLDSEDTNQDEYVVFKEVMQNIERTDTVWYRALTGHLTSEQQKALQEIILLADQRKAALESKRIEQSGGYAFHSQTVPTSFNFGGTPLSR
ncbi:importin-7 msk [Megachile rotundata]|uniref:importin-7 msk n=1 Tax=Megachile rotundata TaxID=143995 RepID=UPI000614CD27|nr:PREDICTED: importin-7 [Megachile rotundata]XP_012141646.1 PREDICTED: importin-7 [Megachile rotundata]XP_012141647.1 PREDICTED: importin-7 [Megachile rotundata]XP_012141648.1 PREDICTED: importin-7 [Megachile rotundata]